MSSQTSTFTQQALASAEKLLLEKYKYWYLEEGEKQYQEDKSKHTYDEMVGIIEQYEEDDRNVGEAWHREQDRLERIEALNWQRLITGLFRLEAQKCLQLCSKYSSFVPEPVECVYPPGKREYSYCS